MDQSRIQDIPKIKKTLEDIKAVRTIKSAMPFVEPLLKLFNVDTDKIHEALNKVSELERMAEELATIPDDFNDLFASRGWIIYDVLNLEVAKEAISRAKAGAIDEAENILVNYYSPNTVKINLQMMIGVKAFRARMPLAQKALIDYSEERYHASIPVVLALMDGLVNELHERKRGFSSDQTDLQAWDSIAGHSKGLNTLVKVFQTGRYTTRTEQIAIPYRNGILHGMDLGYDNKIVAAKTWAALFAVRDWALKAEKGELIAPPEAPKPTFSNLIQTIKQVSEDKNKIDTWQSREIIFGVHFPSTGEPEDYIAGSPERKLVEFLSYWKKRNYGYMAKYLPYLDKKYNQSKLPKRIREHYSDKILQSFELIEFLADGVNVAIIKAKLLYLNRNSLTETIVEFRILYEDELGKPSIRDKEGHDWVIYNAYV